MQASTRRPSPALVVAIIALIVSLTGTAWAVSALPKNSVGSRQLKSKSVTTGKIASNAVNGSKVANSSLTGQDIDLSKLGTVPTAATAESAGRASALLDAEGKLHSAGCPAGTVLVRGICFDVNLNPAVERRPGGRRRLRRQRRLPADRHGALLGSRRPQPRRLLEPAELRDHRLADRRPGR